MTSKTFLWKALILPDEGRFEVDSKPGLKPTIPLALASAAPLFGSLAEAAPLHSAVARHGWQIRDRDIDLRRSRPRLYSDTGETPVLVRD
jgi:hypothetical protein